jgi:xanthine dehydrogenase iron-sulfur cluster and FAD-binding subunit A
MWHAFYKANTTEEAIRLLAELGPRARLVAGATDIILELERGARPGVDTLIDVTRIPGLDEISRDTDGTIHIGGLVTHNDCASSPLIRERAFPLARAAWEVGAPQIRNRGTVAGNLITASPANDTIPPLIALDASVRLASVEGMRTVRLNDFYTGVRKTVMQPDEMLVEIFFKGLEVDQRGTFLKLALRRAQAISVVNAAIILNGELPSIDTATIALGAVAPTIIHAVSAEQFLVDKSLDETTILRAADLAAADSRPIDDLRGSAAYRRQMVRVLVARGLRALREGRERAGIPDNPITLSGAKTVVREGLSGSSESPQPIGIIHTTINGVKRTFASGQNKTLLRFLREDAGLTGSKEGCAEGECGACTVFLDGQAVMACMVPAPRADGADIMTIEGLANPGNQYATLEEDQTKTLHRVQQAFIETGAVQCGYCTPGFLMAGAKLLEERTHPTRSEIEQAITGNLCRCTGYYKIVQAIEHAAQMEEVIHG